MNERAAGMQPMLIIGFFLKDVPWSMMDYQHATQGEVLSKKKSLGPSGGYESKHKNEGCQTAQKEGRRG